MVNQKGGKKKKRGAKYSQERAKREILLKQMGQEYGYVEKMLGDMRCQVQCEDRTTKICHIRGRFKHRIWINCGDVVLVSLRDFEEGKGDIVHKYNAEEVDFLRSNGYFSMDLEKDDSQINYMGLLENSDDSEDEEGEENIVFLEDL